MRSARQVRLVAPSSSRPLRFINFLISHAGREWVPGVFSSARSFAACVARFTYGVRQLAQSGLQNQIRPEHHRDAVPVFFSDECRSFVRGTQREGAWLLDHEIARLPLRNLVQFLGCSIIQQVNRLASDRARCEAAAVHHFQIPGRFRTQRVSYARLSWCESTSRNHCRGARWDGTGLISRLPSGFDSRPCDHFHLAREKREISRNSFVPFREFRGPKLRR